MKIAVSYLKSNFSKEDTIKLVDESNADMIHVDLMDGIYCGKQNFNKKSIITDLEKTHKPLDVHLMVMHPEDYIDILLELTNIDTITFHLDATEIASDLIDYIHSKNIKVGVAVNPDDYYLSEYALNKIDYVLIMSVYPGKGGQTFIERTLNTLKYYQDKDVLLGIDGGINNNTINYLKEYRIDNVISGSYVCCSNNYNERIKELRIK